MIIENKKISIVVHGGCFESNSAEVANILMTYRMVFKDSEIIFSISSSDFIDFSASNEKTIFSYKKHMVSFCNVINEFSDKIAYARMAQPLPPVFRDAPKCHANHLIESAQNGLALATREFVLRTRNDLLFKDSSFLSTYIKLKENYYKKGSYTVFSDPVMIPSLYTLNPFAESRLPFHYSDWFNFGKLSDIRPLWNIPLVTLDFMTYYNSNYYKPGSTEKERNFFSRTAIEQYIYFNFFSKHFDNIKLNYHNDDSSISESIEILIDNFIVTDIFELNVYYPKYYNGFNSFKDNNTRIMQRSWEYLSSHRDADPSKFLYVSHENIRDYAPKIFPLKIGSEQLYSKIGFHFGKSIIIPKDAPPGVCCFGPHITLDKGKYFAKITLSALYPTDNNCKLKISATGEEGCVLLNTVEFSFDKVDGYENIFHLLDVEFENRYDLLRKFEIIIESTSTIDMAIDYIEIFKS